MNKIIKILKNNGIGVLPTDTVYGLVGSAFSHRAVARIYKLRKRDPKKPMIILIGAIRDLKRFGIKPTPRLNEFLDNIWPGPVSVILPISTKRQETRDKFKYLHRGTGTLALRLPKSKFILGVLKRTGPLVAPSANFEGKPPATNTAEAEKYFGARVDFYIDRGPRRSSPSTLIEVIR